MFGISGYNWLDQLGVSVSLYTIRGTKILTRQGRRSEKQASEVEDSQQLAMGGILTGKEFRLDCVSSEVEE